MRDPRGRGDVSVRETEPGGADDGLLVFAVGLVLAACGALDASQNVGAELGAGARLAGALGLRDRSRSAAAVAIASSSGASTPSVFWPKGMTLLSIEEYQR